jgi:uncharacterized protein DUF6518
MRAWSWRNVGIAVAGALVFGVGMSVLKGNDGGAVRGAIANLSAPWLLLAFIAGALAGGGRVAPAALVGALVSFVALGGFYVANSFVLHLGPHPWLDDLRLAFGNGYFFRFAALSGPLLGALGAVWQRTRSRPLGVLVAALLVLEPFAWLAYYGSFSTGDVPVWAAEVVVGLVACAMLARPARTRRTPA